MRRLLVVLRETTTVDTHRLVPSHSTVTGLAVGAQILSSLFRRASDSPRELVGEHDRQRHELGRLAHGEPEHQALVTGAAGVDALTDVGRLAVNGRQHRARLGVEAVFAARVADVSDDIADDALRVEDRGRRDLTGDDGQAGRDQRFARVARHRILGDDEVEDAVEI